MVDMAHERLDEHRLLLDIYADVQDDAFAHVE